MKFFSSALIFSRGIWKIPGLSAFFPECRLKYRLFPVSPDGCAVMGWGFRPTSDRARAYARRKGLPYIALEDGFLRSAGLGVQGWPPFALVWDDVGIYYDTSRPSRLERLILVSEDLSEEVRKEAERAADYIVRHGISKYNHAPDYAAQGGSGKQAVLLVDQTFGDMAVRYGGADEQTFQTAFEAACAENPDAEIWIKTHPDVLCGKKRGYFDAFLQHGRVKVLAEDINPVSLLKQVEKVYCVTSQLGFEALLCGKPVVVFGRPWYSGWGLTDDRHADVPKMVADGRRQPRMLWQLFAAAYMQYSRYINPNTGNSGSLDDVLEYLAKMRRLDNRLRGHIYCVGMSLWKRAVIKPFFRLPSCTLHFVRSVKQIPFGSLPDNSRILLWGQGDNGVEEAAFLHDVPVLRMEDGFVRSVGLGTNLVPALSLVIDDLGIYFDARKPSRLEEILQNGGFSEEELCRAAALRKTLTGQGITKYNVGSAGFVRPQADKKVILVPGQVETDASVRFGSPEIRKNADLLAAVRERFPDAFIIYKPHPDVVSGNRVGSVDKEITDRLADWVETDADMASCLEAVDEVHTMTSLTGFEALLRGKKVCCYGQPFYAGWGLTEDVFPVGRRQRRLKIDELVCGTLILYPQYADHRRSCLIDVQTALALLQEQRTAARAGGVRQNWLIKQAGRLFQLWKLLRR